MDHEGVGGEASRARPSVVRPSTRRKPKKKGI